MLTTPDGQQLTASLLSPIVTPDKEGTSVSMENPVQTSTPGVADPEGSELTELRPVPTEEPTTSSYLPMTQQYISKSHNIYLWYYLYHHIDHHLYLWYNLYHEYLPLL